MRLRIGIAVFLLLFWSAFPLLAAEPHLIPDRDILALSKEAPSLSTYSETRGLVWRRAVNYKLLADGSMERRNTWVLLCGAQLPESWKTWHIPAPLEKGEVFVDEALLYHSLTPITFETLPVENETIQGVKGVVVRAQPRPGDILVLSFRQVFPKRHNIDDLLFLSLDLPIWEQQVEVETPAGAELDWKGIGIGQPERSTVAGISRYLWSSINHLPLGSETLLVVDQPILAFSLRGAADLRSSLLSLEELTSQFKAPPLLPSLSTKGKGSSKVTMGLQCLDFLGSSQNELKNLPWDWVRSESLPPRGPWTSWERAFIAQAWLRELGWECSLLWEPCFPLNEGNVLRTTRLWSSPVLLLRAPGGKETLFKIGQLTPFGSTPPELLGKTLYGLKNGKVYEKKVPLGKPNDNKLSLSWKLDLDENGLAQGTLDVSVRGGWVEVLPKPQENTPLLAGDRLLDAMLLTPNALDAKGNLFEKKDNGYRIRFDVKSTPGIVAGKEMLLRLPGATPVVLSKLQESVLPLRLRFPFSIEQTFFITTPKSYAVLALPNPTKTESKDGSLFEGYEYNIKKRLLIGTLLWTVKLDTVDEAHVKDFSLGLQRYLEWSGRNVPLRKR